MIQRLQAKRNEEGFTLIELLIVIIVLGILAAIVVFAVSGTRKDAVASSCKTAVASIELSAEGVLAKNGSYPALGNSAAPGDLLDSANKGGLLKKWPAEDDFILQWNGTSKAVEIYSTEDADGAYSVTATGVLEGDGSAVEAADVKTCATV